ncbi:hypothetical protein DICPUDRAFT_85451 [Dictyostelium purpureum]|uniref:Uncharacterized protein n=1 Tax=Dictyostelium purpureum TaxID=5786 RepID=F1A5S2_DICPU|nr:uncharacterized protein DICPUDRAFT_85451 [Dictyostelium purpureum]EGC28459.1 hypothetical protein DICPUDRAFT_85451 [Dictyostelium purpureum]|eukprot:XP_003295015.1 hypothetical protein DICPUDRAFT_85451 [Dictyostelium purpureum]
MNFLTLSFKIHKFEKNEKMKLRIPKMGKTLKKGYKKENKQNNRKKRSKSNKNHIIPNDDNGSLKESIPINDKRSFKINSVDINNSYYISCDNLQLNELTDNIKLGYNTIVMGSFKSGKTFHMKSLAMEKGIF